MTDKEFLKEIYDSYQQPDNVSYGKDGYITRLDYGEFRIEFGRDTHRLYTDKEMLKKLRWHTKYSIEELLK